MARRRKGKSGKKQKQRKNQPAALASQPRQVAQTANAPAAQGTATGQGGEPRRSQAQKRAADALAKVTVLRDGNDYGNYRSYVKALPARIIMNGLGQALAMEKAGASKDAGHEKLFEHVQDWLLTGWENSPYRGQEDLIAAITEGEESDYIRAQGEAMAYVEWLKKFAVAYLEDKDDKRKDGQPEGSDDAAAS